MKFLTILNNFPFFKFNKIKLRDEKIIYEKHFIGDKQITKSQRETISRNRKLLLDNRIQINKIRFVFESTFIYDIDNNTINPKYKVLIPIDMNTGLFKKDEPIIEIGKPDKLILINVHGFNTNDNFILLNQHLKNSKRGIVIQISDEYNYRVDDDIIRMINLDFAVENDKLWDYL